MKKPESICVFGDSTAWGAWDMEKGGWVTRLWLYVGNREENYVELYNQSISGGSTSTIMERFESEAKIRGADGLIFQFGANDSYLTSKDSPNNISIEKFEQNLRDIIVSAVKITDKIIFFGLKNCDESKTTPVSWGNYYYFNSEIEKYDNIMEKVCKESGILYLKMRGMLDGSDFEDGIHPNAKGHQKIFEKTRDFLVQNNWI